MLKVINSDKYTRWFKPISNHLEDIYIISVGIVESWRIHEHQIGKSYLWNRKSNVADFARTWL